MGRGQGVVSAGSSPQLRAAQVAISVALGLATIKLFGFQATQSVALLSSAVDSCLDAVASLINLVAVRQALVPPDRGHRFGHGKAEALAGVFQAVLIGLSAVYVVIEAAERLANPAPVSESGVGIVVMAVSMVATLALVRYQRRVARRSSSLAISADAAHYFSDVLANIVVVIALVLAAMPQLAWLDPLIAFGVAGYILHSAWVVVRTAGDQLMDHELPGDVREQIETAIRDVGEIRKLVDLRTRASGADRFVQARICLDSGLSLVEAHAIATRVSEVVRRVLPGAQVHIVPEPAGASVMKAGRRSADATEH